MYKYRQRPADRNKATGPQTKQQQPTGSKKQTAKNLYNQTEKLNRKTTKSQQQPRRKNTKLTNHTIKRTPFPFIQQARSLSHFADKPLP
jgi:hypothetical protein